MTEKTQIELITLEDNRVCIILDEITVNENKYLYLVNSQKKDDFIIRKVLNDELVGLDNEEEFNNIIEIFLSKNIERI